MNMFTQKRSRDEFAGDGDPDGQVIHERKRPRPLPFRTSPTTKHTTSFSQHHQFIPSSDHTLTPTESSDEDEDDGKPQKPKQALRAPVGLPFLQHGAEYQGGSTDCDMEMVDPEPQPQPTGTMSPWSAGLTNNGGTLMPSPIPGHLINQSLSISGGRTATPIYGHFTRNMDPNVMSQTASPRLRAPSWENMPSSAPSTAESDWWRRRRLPSPISESEDSLASPADFVTKHLQPTYGEELNNFHEGFRTAPSTSQNQLYNGERPSLPRIITSNADENGIGQGHLQSHMETSTPNSHRFPTIDPSSSGEASTNTPTVTSSGRSSGFGSSSGGKISFSMGYRADCDKCLRKVPGHYSHIIRS